MAYPESRVESILQASIDGNDYTGYPESRIEELLIALNDKIKNAKIYKIGGSKLFAELGVPSANTMGWCYNIEDAFTTNQYFIDGAGKSYPAGTNVVGIVRENPTTGVEEYWWDTISGFIDLSGYLLKIEAADTYVAKTDLGDTVPTLDENGKIPEEQLDNIQINGIDLYGEDNTLADLGMQTISSAELEALWNN